MAPSGQASTQELLELAGMQQKDLIPEDKLQSLKSEGKISDDKIESVLPLISDRNSEFYVLPYALDMKALQRIGDRYRDLKSQTGDHGGKARYEQAEQQYKRLIEPAASIRWKARNLYRDDLERELTQGATFEQWCEYNFPQLGALRMQSQASRQALEMTWLQVYGPENERIQQVVLDRDLLDNNRFE